MKELKSIIEIHKDAELVFEKCGKKSSELWECTVAQKYNIDFLRNDLKRLENEKLRDEFAKSALQGLLGSKVFAISDFELYVKTSYKLADEMLKQRKS